MNNNLPPLTKDTIELKYSQNQTVNLSHLSAAILQEAKTNKNFPNAEWLFNKAMATYHSREKQGCNIQIDDKSIRRCTATMVRYASTPEKSLHYATLFFQEFNKRIRNPSSEVIVLTNLIFAHANQPNQRNMDMALKILKLALQLGIYKIDPSCYHGKDNSTFGDPLEVFSTVSQRVLNHFKLVLSPDKTELVSCARYSS